MCFLQLVAYDVGALCSLLKAKAKSQVTVLAACLLMKALQDQRHWPEQVAWTFVEDAAGERLWVDLDEARPLVENITASFGTKQPNKLILPSEITGLGRSESPGSDDEAATSKNEAADEKMETGQVSKRYREEVLEAIVIETVREHLSRRQQPDAVGRNLLKLMASTSGFLEVRKRNSSI